MVFGFTLIALFLREDGLFLDKDNALSSKYILYITKHYRLHTTQFVKQNCG